MTREELQALIDRVIGKKGILRAPSYWMRWIFGKVIEYGESYTKKAVDNAKVTVDTEMSDESTNPVQNTAIKAYVDGKSVTVDTQPSLYSSNAISNKGITQYVKDNIRRNYLAFTIVGGSAQLSHSRGVRYSLDAGVTWETCYGFKDVANPPDPKVIPEGSTVLFKQYLHIPQSISSADGIGYFKVEFANQGGVYIHGNIMSLLYDDFENRIIVPAYAFINVFKSVPILGIDKGLLPALEVGDYAYSYLFAGLKNIPRFPDLPAISIGKGSYSNMCDFAGGLLPTAELPAGDLTQSCYSGMYYNSRIRRSPVIYINEILGTFVFRSMFEHSDIERMAEFRVINDVGATIGVDRMFYRTFANCPRLTEVELPKFRGLSVPNVFVETFEGSSNLRRIKFIVEDNASINLSAFNNWVSGVAEEGVFVTTSYVRSILPVGVNGIPEGWTVEEVAV